MIPYRVIAALALAIALTGGAYLKGRADNEARHTAAALVQAQADAEATRKLAAAEQEARLLARFGDRLRPEDHASRMDRLVWANRITPAGS